MGSHVAAPVLTPNVKYDSERDFDPIGLTAHAPAVIVARKDFPATNLSDFVDYLKQNYGNYVRALDNIKYSIKHDAATKSDFENQLHKEIREAK